jgi:hypothetical protein
MSQIIGVLNVQSVKRKNWKDYIQKNKRYNPLFYSTTLIRNY